MQNPVLKGNSIIEIALTLSDTFDRLTPSIGIDFSEIWAFWVGF